MSFVTLHKDQPFEQFGHFKSSELFSDSLDAPKQHELSEITIEALNIIRDYYNIPITPTSTYRTAAHEFSLGKVTLGAHFRKEAIDATFTNKSEREIYLRDYNSQILTKGPLFKLLRRAGINGFGIYNADNHGFFHIDSRNEPTNGKYLTDEFGNYNFWDDRTDKELPNENLIASAKNFFFNGYGQEDGTKGYGKYSLLIRIGIFLVLVWLLRKINLIMFYNK